MSNSNVFSHLQQRGYKALQTKHWVHEVMPSAAHLGLFRALCAEATDHIWIFSAVMNHSGFPKYIHERRIPVHLNQSIVSCTAICSILQLLSRFVLVLASSLMCSTVDIVCTGV